MTLTYPDSFIDQVVQGDCLEVMKSLPDGCVDMVLCDLPYGTTRNKWDSVLDLASLWSQYSRVCKPNAALVFTAQTPFDKSLASSNINLLKYEWIWKKNIATGHMNANKMPMKEHENILVFYSEPPIYNPQMVEGKPYKMKRQPKNDAGTNYGVMVRTDTVNEGLRYPKSVLEFDREVGLHPTQKPVPLFEYLIKTYTNEGDLVLDNCIGSGTTGVAALNTGRHFIGIELSQEYCAIAQQRIDQVRNNILTPV